MASAALAAAVAIEHRRVAVKRGAPAAAPEEDECSPSSEELERARREKRRRRVSRTTAAVQTLFDPRPTAAALAPPEAAAVVLEDIGTLYRDFPQVGEALLPPSPPRGPVASGAAGERALARREPHPRHPLHRENPDAKPYLVEEFRALLASLPRPVFSFLPLGPAGPVLEDQARLTQALRETREDRRLELPVLRADYESRLLAEAGTFPLAQGSRRITYPACSWAERCVGRTQQLRGLPPGGVTLTAVLFPEELETLLATGQSGVAPRPCILCYRFHAMDFLYTLQPNFQRVGGVVEGVVQIFRNLCDEPGGYFRECLLHPSATRFEGFVDNVALFIHSALLAHRDPLQGGRWVVDQSAMVFPDAAPAPVGPVAPGQPVGVF